MPNSLAKYICCYLMLAAGFFVVVSCNDRKKDRKDILQTWENYKRAIYRSDGAAAVKCLDSTTLNYYTGMLFEIKADDSLTIEHLRFDKKILVLGTRHTASRDEILKMDGKTLFAHCVTTGMLTPVDSNKFHLSILSVNGNLASTELADSSGKGILPIEFHREYGCWRMNIISFRKLLTDEVWKAIIDKSGMTERDFIDAALTLMNNKEPQNYIWHPINTY